MIDRLKGLYKDEEGATMVEYALIVAVIAIVALVGARVLGTGVDAKFDSVDSALDTP